MSERMLVVAPVLRCWIVRKGNFVTAPTGLMTLLSSLSLRMLCRTGMTNDVLYIVVCRATAVLLVVLLVLMYCVGVLRAVRSVPYAV
jgi:hypothetical protein